MSRCVFQDDANDFKFLIGLILWLVRRGQSFTETYSQACLHWISELKEVEFYTVSSPAPSVHEEEVKIHGSGEHVLIW